MSKATRLQFEELITRAVTDTEFLARLIADPRGAAYSISIDLDDDDVAELASLATDLTRFSKAGHLAADDAKSWAVGILHIRTIRAH